MKLSFLSNTILSSEWCLFSVLPLVGIVIWVGSFMQKFIKKKNPKNNKLIYYVHLINFKRSFSIKCFPRFPDLRYDRGPMIPGPCWSAASVDLTFITEKRLTNGWKWYKTRLRWAWNISKCSGCSKSGIILTVMRYIILHELSAETEIPFWSILKTFRAKRITIRNMTIKYF